MALLFCPPAVDWIPVWKKTMPKMLEIKNCPLTFGPFRHMISVL